MMTLYCYTQNQCDSCNILWVVNGIDYGNNKELKIIGKEDISVSLFITLKDSTYNSALKDSTTITVNRAPEFEINYETTEDNGTISTYLTPIVVNDYSNGKYDIFRTEHLIGILEMEHLKPQHTQDTSIQ